MKLFVRAIVTGFGLSIGAALFKKFSTQLGLGEQDKAKAAGGNDIAAQDAATDPSLRTT